MKIKKNEITNIKAKLKKMKMEDIDVVEGMDKTAIKDKMVKKMNSKHKHWVIDILKTPR